MALRKQYQPMASTHTSLIRPDKHIRYSDEHLVEDNASPHVNAKIRERHTDKKNPPRRLQCHSGGKAEIVRLVTIQTANYKREQDKKAQITNQTRELDRLSA